MGIGFILFIECFLDYINVIYQNITINEKIVSVLLLLTAVVIFWYTKETYELKKHAVKNEWGLISVDVESTKKHTNFAGLIDYREESNNRYINIRLFLKNIGKGVLTLTKIECSGCSSISKVGETKIPELKLAPHGGIEDWNGKILSVQDTVEADYMLYISKWYEGKVSFFLNVLYKDILGEYKHKIIFHNIDLKTYNFDIHDKGKLVKENK